MNLDVPASRITVSEDGESLVIRWSTPAGWQRAEFVIGPNGATALLDYIGVDQGDGQWLRIHRPTLEDIPRALQDLVEAQGFDIANDQ